MTVNERIVLLSKVMKLSQADLARQCGLSKTKVSRIFRNCCVVDINDLIKISVKLKIPMTILVGEIEFVDRLLSTLQAEQEYNEELIKEK